MKLSSAGWGCNAAGGIDAVGSWGSAAAAAAAVDRNQGPDG
jgi:hypothetical protein